MKQISKSFLARLALTLFGGAGAWAQTDYYVVGSFNSWGQNDSYKMTYTDYVNAYTFTLDLSTSDMVKVASFDGGTQYYPGGTGNAYGENSEILADGTYTIYFRPQNDSINWFGGYFNVVAGTLPDPPDQAIELTKVGANQWTLGQTPDYDLELQVEYYGEYALKNIPAGWQVLVNGVDKTAAIDGDSLNITETDSVTLIPDNPSRVKSVTLADDATAVQTITVAGLQLNYVEGENWVQTAQRNPGVIEIDGSYVNKTSGYFLKAGGSVVSPTSTYDSSLGYGWEEW